MDDAPSLVRADTLWFFRGQITQEKAFKQGKLKELVAIVSANIEITELGKFAAIFKNDEVLALQEKRDLGLNTRYKYSRRVLTFFDIALLGGRHPLHVLERAFWDASSRAQRKHALHEWKGFGVRVVEISPVSPCAAVQKMHKRWPIDKAPILPLEQCDRAAMGQHCTCLYLPIREY